MPNESKKRPDTLELEVIDGYNETSDDDDKNHRQTKRLAIKCPKKKPEVFNLARSATESNQSSRKRWFLSGPRTSKESEALTTTTTAFPPLTLPRNQTRSEKIFATLAKPEPSTIDNSVTTDCSTPRPQNTTNRIHSSAAVPQRSDDNFIERGIRTETDSIYSLATVAPTGELTLSPCLEDRLKKGFSSYDNSATELEDICYTTNLHSYNETREQVLPCGDTTHVRPIAPSSEERNEIEGATLPKAGLQANFISMLGKLAFWNRSTCQCQQQQKRRCRKTHSGHETNKVEGSTDNLTSQNGERKRSHLNISTDFEHLGLNQSKSSGSIFESAKNQKGIRRLSQLRRRRSSYYYTDTERRIRANDREFNAQFKYTDNYIKTSKYSLLTFLPYNLLEQFQRLANFYFLCLLVLQLIPAISSLTPVTTAIPLIGVLTLTAIKDAYDDIQRHMSDSQVNNRRSKTLRNGKLIEAKWSGVQVGDVIRLENNQFVAADILLLTTSEPNGLCFIETAELDGETNLKCKQCLPETIEMSQRHDLLWNFNGEIICERPNNLLNKFDGTLLWRNQRYSLDNEKILLRGCVLRNTQWCYGVVIFAGKDTKLMQNSGKTQFKSTGVDRILNFIIIGIVLFLLSICAFFTLACAIWEGFIGQHFQTFLPWENIIPKDVYQGATVIGLLVFFSYAIVLNTVVPISLYVSVEVIRFAQSFLINWDEEMYYERSKTHAKARTTTLNEELGQIQYIFSDKTGTLTQNIMTFNKCSINGRAYGDVIDLRTGEVIEVTDKQKNIHVSSTSNSAGTNKNSMNPPPTILLHTAGVYAKANVVVTKSPSRTSMTRDSSSPSIAPISSSLIQNDSTSTAFHKANEEHGTTKTSRDQAQKSFSINPHSINSTARHVQYAVDICDGSPSEVSYCRTLSSPSISDRLGCQISSCSDASDNRKVMTINDVPQTKATLIVSSNSHKTKSSNHKNYCTAAISSDILNSDTISIAPLSAQTTSLQSPVSNKNSFPSFFYKNLSEASTCSNTNKGKTKNSKNYNNSSFCAPFCLKNNNANNNYQIPPSVDGPFKTNTYATSTCTRTIATTWKSSTYHKVHALEPVDFSANPEYEADFRWYDKTLLDAVRTDEEHAQSFFRLLALCHTVMPEYVEGRLEYQAQSPDEAALVSAARNFGFVFRSRTPNSITIEVMGRTEEYELVNILDFNNVRKRMSVILRRGSDVILYCKGADNVIYDRLGSKQEDIKARTQDHLNKFAGEGLRTLVLAERHLDENYFSDWSRRQQEAAISMDNREDKLNEIYEEIESELVLLGVTAIEDKLQDGVPQAIANLQTAGIKIWVLTGDKQETAINIGYSCQLLTDELADIFIVDGNSIEEVEKQLRQFKETIRILNRFRPAPLEATDNLNLNGDRNLMQNTSDFRAEVSPPPPPAISVVTFRWDADTIKHNKGEPDSAECNTLYNNLEKGSNASATIRSEDILEENSGFAIVINGHSLVYCLSPELESKFLDIATQCKAVICCRVTPLQKALVVELIKRAKNAVTLAIGDGANDVSMIKAAHIGVGISGQEGLQAVLASDYSIAQFRYLERLLLVHGRWSYYRMCKFLRYFFYKNFAFTLCHCWYSFFCGFSAQTVFDPMFISVYNLFYTSLPVLALGVFEQDVSDKHSLEFPKLYTPGLKSQLFNTREFVYSVLHGAFSSLILFLIPYGTYKNGISPDGLTLSDHMTLGAVVATILIIDNTAQIALYTSYWTIVNHVMIWGSLIWYFVLDYFYNYVIGGPYVGSLTQAMKDLTFWVTMFITVIVIMAPVLAYKFYLIDVHPSLSDKIRLKRREASLRLRQSNIVLRTPSSRRARRSLRSGYAFAHQEGFGRLITSGKIMRKLPQEFAFPLGLGSKKIQSAPNDMKNNQQANNNNSLEGNQDSTPAHLEGKEPNGECATPNKNDDDRSPQAPYQDLDTINL